jgi:alkanesulfonate monooxygenase SsuD/methylene tetrahydromethanopterin reductase-like flavin-dependent oxidoreductase (luciferase family)
MWAMKIGLMLPIGEEESLGRPLGWDHLRAMALAAEEGGLDSVWAPDHLIFDDGDKPTGIHECWTLLSAIAAITTRVELGPLVLAVPFRNPALTAKMAAMLDEISGGRLILGLGCGWHEPEFTAFDYPFDHRVGRFEEALEVILPMLRDGRTSFEGRWHRADAELLPRGPRPNGPPILIAGKQPRMFTLIARHADAWNAAWFGPPETADELDRRLVGLRAACEAEGRDPGTLNLTAGVFVDFTDGTAGAPERAMRGDTEAIGRAMAGYAERGIEHLIVHVWPRTPDGVGQLARAAAVAREAAAATAPA